MASEGPTASPAPTVSTVPAGKSPAAKPKAAPSSPDGNIKDTIESILVAFILAFIFRAFVVEAFVIPTGSMAPTLMGAHTRFRCPDCGYQFDVNFSIGPSDDAQIPDYARTQPERDFPDGRPIIYANQPVLRDRADQSVYTSPIYCPNCARQIPQTSSRDPDNDGTSPAVFYGDRILVLKYLYLFQDPRRWDVVVFKAPSEKRRNYGENYIKRLVGLPGETIMILDGDVYAKAPGSNAFVIQRKPYAVQKDLWRVVYDNDYIPHDPTSGPNSSRANPWRQPWKADGGGGWELAAKPGDDPSVKPSRVFRFHNAAGDGALTFDPTANSEIHPMTDWLAYDQAGSGNNEFYSVSDLDLACDYQRKSGDGAFNLQLTKGPDVFTARLTRGRVQLLHSQGQGPETVMKDVPAPELDGSRPVRLEFANCDYRVWLRVDGREVFQTTDDDYYPEWLKAAKEAGWQDLEPLARKYDRTQAGGARVTAEKQEADIEHLRLSRDIYYISQGTVNGSPYWGSPSNPITLRGGPQGRSRGEANEYFVLGDNSRISGDARMWTDPVHLPAEMLDVEPGRVPEEFMLGKAFFVYWPAGYRPFSKGFGQSNPTLNPGIIPNFGDMRSIH